ncbi:amidohydrolase [Bacillus sp. M6-12]|uniref:amidohydrolase n=1 Tax=Bacillus sp. M6-12 TaxID=2054166 RepID=UPI000C7724D9|nr:amidohydrolase [Bacillus sp. M6-12]PLS14851.1 amidohydrolase [Bacillus sp. M6-12]
MGTLWFGGKIYTMEAENTEVEAVYTDSGRILKAGSLMEIRKVFHSAITDEIHLNGNTMLPGLVDSHMHLIGHGERLMRLDLSSLKSRQAVLEAVKDKCSQTEKGEWIIGEGWNENEWDSQELIHLDDLDKISDEHPILLKRVCRHALVVNSFAMRLANITEQTKNPAGGVIGRNQDGRINGLLKDQAQELLLSCLPDISGDYLTKALRTAISDCYQLGLTGVHSEDLHYYNGFSSTYEAIYKVIQEEEMKFRTNLLVHYEVVEDMAESGLKEESGSQFIELGAMKIFADGSLGGRTALLSHPYADDPETNGVAIHSREELALLTAKARRFGMPVAIHAIGDLAFEYALHAIETHPPLKGQRDRLIHAQVLNRELIEKAKSLPVIFDIQPIFVAADFPWVIEKIGQEFMKYAYAWKTLINQGIVCAGGSDAPVENANPLLGIHAAVTRSKPGKEKREVFAEEQCLSMYEAVSLFTKGSAYAAGREHESGQIKEGFLADFTVLDKDIFKIDPDELLDIKAVMTVVDGEAVFTSSKLNRKKDSNNS